MDPGDPSAASRGVDGDDGFVEIGSFGDYICGHASFCDAYVPGDRQRHRGDGLCCDNLSPGLFSVEALADSNRCCGTTSRVKVMSDTGEQVGYLDCHNAKWVAALLAAKLVHVEGDAGCIMHLIGHVGVPVTWVVTGALPALAAAKDDPIIGPSIAGMLQSLGSDFTRSDTMDLGSPEPEICMSLSSESVPDPVCTCTSKTCFLAKFSRRGRH